MQTALADFIKDTPEGREADAILRTCVHCGFCNATCPTYQLLGDELDGPRGRIYLIKQVLEGRPVTAKTQLHLDRCLTCRNCETTCPSGVQYGRLLDIGRHVVDQRVGRTPAEQAVRWTLRRGLMAKPLFGGALAVGRAMKSLLPRDLRAKVPDVAPAGVWPRAAPRAQDARRSTAACSRRWRPSIDAAMARILDRIGISLVRGGGGCCGALPHHLDEIGEAICARQAQHRRLVAAPRPRCRGGDRHRERLRRDGQGLRVPAAVGPRLRAARRSASPTSPATRSR